MESSITAKLATNSSKLIEKYQFLSLNYWFGSPEAANLASLLPLIIIVSLIFILALVLITIKLLRTNLPAPEAKFLTKAIWLILFFGPIGWFLIILRILGVVLLSARFFWLIWFGLLIWVAYYLLNYYRKVLPKAKATFASYQLKKRYFPKKKRR